VRRHPPQAGRSQKSQQQQRSGCAVLGGTRDAAPSRQALYHLGLNFKASRANSMHQVYSPASASFQVRRPDFLVFELFNAAWCVRTPQPRGTQPRLRCSVVGLLRAPPAPRLGLGFCRCRGSASCAFPALSPTRFGLFVATKPHTSGGRLAALRVPVGEGDSRWFSGVQ
jgi:hypothetical protein